MRTKLKTILGAAAAALVFAAAGCSAAPAVQETAAPAPTEEPTPLPTVEATAAPEPETPSPEPSYVSFGTESPEAQQAIFENGTGQSIIQLQTKSSEAQDFGTDLMTEGQQIAPGELFRLYVTPEAEPTEAPAAEEAADDAEAVPEEPSPLDVDFNETYDVALTLADGTQAILYDLGLNDIDTALIGFQPEQNVAYVTYVSTQTAEQVSTLEAQAARRLAEQAAETADSSSQQSSSSSGETERPSGSSGNSSSGSSGGGESSASGSGSSAGSSSESSGGSSGGSASSDSDNSGSSGGSDEGPDQSTGGCLDEDDIVWID